MVVGLRNVLLLSACLILFTGQAWAVALGKLEVTSHLGETFFAEAPIQLEEDEKISDVTVGLAARSDYQILEVYRDAALNKLSVQVVKDSRGARAVIKSTEAVDTPYFNLVLKLNYGHATNFKKFPVFLDLPERIRPPVAVTAPVQSAPAVKMQAEPDTSAAVAPVEGAAAESGSQAGGIESKGSEFQPYAGWARSGRYGPMVHGDSITTVARRLRVDDRYTLNQVMVGLYNKNKGKFRENNINLINAGTYLDVPSAAEVESVTDAQATAVLKEHTKRWRMLKKQPVYAAEAKAQANRYRTRVSVGQTASGTAAAPVQSEKTKTEPAAMKDQAAPKQTESAPAADTAEQAGSEQLSALQAENLRLKQALQESEAKAENAKPTSADAAAAEEQVKKLELTVARLQRQLKQVNDDLQEVRSQDMNSLVYAMGGMIVLLIAVAGYLLFLLRRDRPHPSMPVSEARSESHPEAEAGDMSSAAMLSGTGDASTDESDEGEPDHASFAASLDANLQDNLPSSDQGAADLYEDKAPTAQQDIDYLAEAEVYLRYGMEDEALQQMHLAIEQKPDHLEAHTKLVQFLQGRGDQEAVDAAIAAARSALSDNDQQAFEIFLQNVHGDDEDDSLQGEVGESASHENGMDAGSEPDMDLKAGSESELDEHPGELDLSGMFGSDEGDTSDREEADSEGLSFDMSESAEPEVEETAADASETEPESDEAQGLDFTPSDVLEAEGDSEEAELSGDEEADKPGLAYESTDESKPLDAEGDPEIELDASADENDLEAVLGDLDTDDSQDSSTEVDFSSAASGVTAYEQDADEEDVPETVIESDSGEDDFGLEDILDELASEESEDSTAEESTGVAEASDESTEEVVTDTASADKDMDLDDILDEFETDEDMHTEQAEEEGDSKGNVAASPEASDVPDMDVGDELDGLLAEWDDEGGAIDLDAGPESLSIDRARSLLAEGSLDEAETSLQAVLDGDRRGDALIGLAEVAAKRGDGARKDELLAEAESLVDDQNREWFDSVRGLSL